MTNFWTKIKHWFKPPPAKKKPQKPMVAKPKLDLNKLEFTNEKLPRTASLKRQRRLIGRLTAQTIARQRQRAYERRRR